MNINQVEGYKEQQEGHGRRGQPAEWSNATAEAGLPDSSDLEGNSCVSAAGQGTTA